MANIIFMPFHWASDMNATFALARKLQTRGHRVHYLCIPDTEERIRAQGFDFTPIFSRVFPRGALAEQHASQVQGKSYGPVEFKARLRGMCELLCDGEISHATRGLHPDLLLTSSGMPWVGIAARKTGLLVVAFSSTLISVCDPEVPPFGTGLIPKPTPLSRLRTRLAWKKLFLRRRLGRRAWDISGELKELARRCDYPLNKIDFKVETWPRLLLPELVFCPKDFDFPRTRQPEGAFFVEASIDTERRDNDFPWERLADDKPLVYCSLGSVVTVTNAQQTASFFQMFMDAMAERPSRQGVVAVGNFLGVDQFKCPANVIAVNEAPQVEVLKRASLMIYHGGISGVKEGILMGVPMLLIPLFYDQPGNAARVVYHRLGVRLPLKKLSTRELGRLIDAVLEDPGYAARAKRMSERFAELETRAPAVEIVERALSGRSLDESAF
jgi:MGT family glycosyltransferase